MKYKILITAFIFVSGFSFGQSASDSLFNTQLKSVKGKIELQEFDKAILELKAIAGDTQDDSKKGMCYYFLYDAYFKKANLEAEKMLYQKAIEDYTNALHFIQIKNTYLEKLKFKPFEAYTSRGICHSLQKNFKSAILDYDKAISIKADHGLAFYNRAVAYHSLGETEIACADYIEAYKNNYPVEMRLIEGCAELIGY